MSYAVFFDVTKLGNAEWDFILVGMFFMLIGASLLVISKRYPNQENFWGFKPPFPTISNYAVGWFILICATLWTTSIFVISITRYLNLVNIVNSHKEEIIEGKVDYFKAPPEDGKGCESFCIRKKCFDYSDTRITGAFNTTSLNGGPVALGKNLRVTYFGNYILKMEVKR